MARTAAEWREVANSQEDSCFVAPAPHTLLNREHAETVATLILRRRMSCDIDALISEQGAGFVVTWTNTYTHEEVAITTVEQWDRIRRCIWYLDPSLDGK